VDRRIDAQVARTQFGQIMDRAVEKNERFVVERRGQPAVVIMSVRDFIRTTAPQPDWLEKAWQGAKRRGLDKLTSADIDAEIATYRARKRALSVLRRSDPRGHRYQRLGIGFDLAPQLKCWPDRDLLSRG
jgi:prevent-host-death family protein